MIDLALEFAKVAMSGLAMIVSAYAWVYSRRAARTKEILDHLQIVESRVTALESAFRSFPSQTSWTQLHTDIAGLRGDLKTSSAQIQGLGAGLNRVEHQISLLMENELRGKGQS